MGIADRIPIGISSCQIFLEGKVDLGQIHAVAEKAEQFGYHSLWTQEQLFGDTVSLEPITLLTYLAAITKKIRLGVSVLVLPLHNPIRLAKVLSSVDQLSTGRIELGVGIGGAQPILSNVHHSLYPKLNISENRRIKRFVESLHVMRALWTEDRPHYDGEIFKLQGDPMQPKPAQPGGPPVWFGARQPNALRRSVRYGDGWMGAGSSTSDSFKGAVITICQYLDEAKRDPASFRISKRVYILVDNNEARAEKRLREWFGQYYQNADNASKVAVWGSPEKCREQLEELVDAGAEHLLLNMVFDPEEQVQALAEITGLIPYSPTRLR
jgi:alkanesulfonate monooxygenase SsuD/methylene tetrahydromethanopterin reductase-like flavin-dependent oxidoreductase (luciferase family)